MSSVSRVETDAPSMMFEIANDNQISNDYSQLVENQATTDTTVRLKQHNEVLDTVHKTSNDMAGDPADTTYTSASVVVMLVNLHVTLELSKLS